MKIFILGNAKSIHVIRWARYFQKARYDVTVLTFELAEIEGVEVIFLGPKKKCSKGLSFTWGLLRLWQLLRKCKPDILHSHYVTSYGFAGALVGYRPFVVTAWGTDVLIRPLQSKVFRSIVRFTLGKADLVTSMSSPMTSHLIKLGLCDPEKIIDLPFGTDTNVFNLAERENLKKTEWITVFSNRRLDDGLSVDTLIQSIPSVVRQSKGVRFLVAGDGNRRFHLEQLVDQLGVRSHVQFLGTVSADMMPDFLRKSDIFVSTAPTDGNNISLCEAMACGVFPIATDIPANRQWVSDGDNGILFEVGNPESLASAINQAVAQSDLRKRVVKRNFQIILHSCDWERQMAIMSDHYQALLKK